MAANPWWSPGQYNNADGTDWGTTTWGTTILEQNPDVAWYRYGREQGVADDGSAFSRWLSSQFPQFQRGYGAYTASNPVTANIHDYLKSLGGIEGFQKQYQALPQQLRGLDPGGRGGGPARWIQR